MMREYPFNKLIRSKLPARMEKEGVVVNAQTLEMEEYIAKLKQKIIEEATEVSESTSHEELITELADVLEVIYAIAEASNISQAEIENVRIEKREINGHFKPEHYVHYIQVAHDNHKVIEYLENKNRPYKFTNE
jgi:predicted house-cleaning noncanonical NTP pyrophosphatase (MazG superfamily)